MQKTTKKKIEAVTQGIEPNAGVEPAALRLRVSRSTDSEGRISEEHLRVREGVLRASRAMQHKILFCIIKVPGLGAGCR